MDYQLKFPESKAVVAIVITVICYYSYYFLINSKSVTLLFSSRYSGQTFYLKKILFSKLAGFIFFAVVPFFIISLFFSFETSDYGVSISKIVENWYWFFGLPTVIFIISYFSAKNSDIYNIYPQMRFKTWSCTNLLLSTMGWSLYLIAYEFLFRGVLLLSCVEAFGVWPAIAINVAIYSAIHLTNGKKETIGAIPFGLIACLLMLSTGSIVIPIVMHISLSVSTEIFAIKNNPEMQFRKST
jgi:membrane protease YdiL (CAAX protease family)